MPIFPLLFYFLLLFCRLQFSIAHLKCSCNSLSKTCPNIANDKTPDNAYSMEKTLCVCFVLFYVSVGILFVFSWWNFYYDFCCKSFVNVLMRKISSFIEFERKKKQNFKKATNFEWNKNWKKTTKLQLEFWWHTKKNLDQFQLERNKNGLCFLWIKTPCVDLVMKSIYSVIARDINRPSHRLPLHEPVQVDTITQ